MIPAIDLSDNRMRPALTIAAVLAAWVLFWLPFEQWQQAEKRLHARLETGRELKAAGEGYLVMNQERTLLQKGSFPSSEDPVLGLKAVAEKAGLSARTAKIASRPVPLAAPYSGMEIDMTLEKVGSTDINIFIDRLSAYPYAFHVQRFQMRRRYNPAQGYDVTITVFSRSLRSAGVPSGNAMQGR